MTDQPRRTENASSFTEFDFICTDKGRHRPTPLLKAMIGPGPDDFRAQERAVVGAPAPALVNLVKEVNADLLVVGNAGLSSSVTGRLLGSVPANVSQRAKTDLLIVHTTDYADRPHHRLRHR